MPAPQLRSEVIVAALQLACRAPSLHNSQPWRWVVGEQFVQLFADPARLVGSTDRTGREALVSCGAALDHFRVAMSAAGWQSSVRRFPDQDDPRHLATVKFTAATVSDEHIRRADAILLRRTDRLPLSAPPEWDRLARSLCQHAARDAVRVQVVADHCRESVAQASRLAEAMHVEDSAYLSDLCWWTAAFAAAEGIPPSSLISTAERERVDIGRTFPAIAHTERRRALAADHSKMLILSTNDSSRVSVLRCGEALSSVLLDASLAGASTCTMTHITEVEPSRDIISSLLPDDAIPQVLVRVGIAPAMEVAPPPTPRRPIEQVLQITRGTTC